MELDTHFESGFGVGRRRRFAPGPVTLLRLGADLERRWVAEGGIEADDADDADAPDKIHRRNLCRTQVTVRLASG